MNIKTLFLLFIFSNLFLNSSKGEKLFIGASFGYQKEQYKTKILHIIDSSQQKTVEIQNTNLNIETNNNLHGNIFIGKTVFNNNIANLNLETGINFYKSSSHNKQENNLNIASNAQFYISAKIGYNLLKNFTLYLNNGVGIKNLKATLYKYAFKKLYFNYIIGLGINYKITNDFAVFYEFNFNYPSDEILLENSLYDFAEINSSAKQMHFGFKYYLH